MKVWLIEDDGFKREKIRAFLSELFPNSQVTEARSAKSAMHLIGRDAPDLVILDMSLPTFDISPRESGGRPQGFGGVEVLREMDRRGLIAPVVVVTQYEAFESDDERMGLPQLKQKLSEDHASIFIDLVYYETASEVWKTSLRDAIQRVSTTHKGAIE